MKNPEKTHDSKPADQNKFKTPSTPNTAKADPAHARQDNKENGRGGDAGTVHHFRQGENNKSPAGG